MSKKTGSMFSPLFFKHLCILLTFSSINFSFSQVYNYTPFEFTTIESNPAILASKEKNNVLNCSQQNNFSNSNPFSTSNVSGSKYLSRSFIGLGISLNNTSLGKNKNHSHLGLSIGYRNILFNKINIKLGMTYKIIQINSPNGRFDYFSFSPTDSLNTNSHSSFSGNLNSSVLLSDGYHKYFLSFAMLNINSPWSNPQSNQLFPNYYIFHIGNFLNIFNTRYGNEISYTCFYKNSSFTNKISIGHYLKIELLTTRLSRKSSIITGSRIGYIINDCYHFIPFVTYFTKRYSIKYTFNFQVDKVTFRQFYNATSQLTFEYKFEKKAPKIRSTGNPSF